MIPTDCRAAIAIYVAVTLDVSLPYSLEIRAVNENNTRLSPLVPHFRKMPKWQPRYRPAARLKALFKSRDGGDTVAAR